MLRCCCFNTLTATVSSHPTNGRYRTNNGQRLVLGLNRYAAIDPKRALTNATMSTYMSRLVFTSARSMCYIYIMQRIAGLFAMLFFLSQAEAQVSPAVQRGLQFSQANCARCHSIDRVSPSSLSIAPPFRNLHRRYPVEDLQVSLAEGIRTGHPNMPELRLDPGQISDLIALLNTQK